MSQYVSFLFSLGGLICCLLAGGSWCLLRPRSTAARRFLLVVVLTYTVASIYGLSSRGSQLLALGFRPFAASDVPPGHVAIVVLGSGSYSAHDWDERWFSVMDPSAANRTLEAARVYRMTKAEWVISSGGKPYRDDPSAPSGDTMRDGLIAMGVPAARILVETKSRNTHDEAVIVKSMFESIKPDHVVLVTSDVHMRRSLGTFRAQGIDAIPAIARHPSFRPPFHAPWLPSDIGLWETASAAHEVLGIAYYLARGWYQF